MDRGNYYAILPMLPEVQDSGDFTPVLTGEYSSADNLMDGATLAGLLRERRLLLEDNVVSGWRVAPMKVLTVLGTRPEIIRLSRVIEKLDSLCDHKLVHTGQNFDQNLSDIFFKQLRVRAPDYSLGVTADTFGQQIGQMLAAVDRVLLSERPDVLLILGDTNSALVQYPG